MQTRDRELLMEPDKDTIKRAARIVRERREQLGRTQDLGEYGGPSRWVITELELKNVWPSRPATQMKIARALNWREDAFDLLARKKAPVPSDVVNSEELISLLRGARSLLEELERRLSQ